jgi:hypothetical protein
MDTDMTQPKTPFYGLDPHGSWNVDTPEGMTRAKEWLERHLEIIGDGAVWAVPRSGSIIRVNKKEKVAVLIAQLTPDPSLGKVFCALGWTWIVKFPYKGGGE